MADLLLVALEIKTLNAVRTSVKGLLIKEKMKLLTCYWFDSLVD